MANLRRHFNFSNKPSISQDVSFSSTSGKTNNCRFDKHLLMNDICNCLDLCCSYIQALNTLCGAGSALAKNLFHAFQEVPAYNNISQQFVSIWEEISRATASASAAVKTETLMVLQEIFNTLEMETSDDETIAEGFQVIGSCMCSFIELQAQFSWSTWKSLSKLSKNFANDSFRHSLQWKSHGRNPNKISMNNDLNAAIKKYFSQIFCKVGISKLNYSVDTDQNQCCTSIQEQNVSSFTQYAPQTVSSDKNCESTAWTPQTTLWPSDMNSHLSVSQLSGKDVQRSAVSNSDLDEVINLLSCVPVQQDVNRNENFSLYSTNTEHMCNFWPKGPSVTRNLSPQHSWLKEARNMNFGYDSWIWRTDNMNCAGLPNDCNTLNTSKERSNEFQASTETKEFYKWNGMYETGSSSDDGSSIHGQDGESLQMKSAFGKHLFKHK